jgi:FkbM family methyltransferase
MLSIFTYLKIRIDAILGFNSANIPKSFIEKQIRNVKTPNIIDVGCSTGEFINICYRANNNSKIFAFDLHASLEKTLNLQFENLDFTFYNIGISDKQGITGVNKLKDLDRKAHLSDITASKSLIKVDTLDNLLGKILDQRISILKVDTEGNDFAVLKGAKKILEHTDVVIFEVMYRMVLNQILPGDILEYLRRQNFQYFYRTSKFFGLIPIKSIMPWEIYTQNIVATRIKLK